MKKRLLAKAGAAMALAFFLALQIPEQARAQSPAPPLSASTIPTEQLLQPEQLNQLLHGAASTRPLILQVGSRMLFDEAHIPGSQYAGPGASAEGLDLLRQRVKPLQKSRFIVLYCGCCPWNRCPNVGAAYKLMREMGFTRVKVLYLADNFGADWVNKGYPSERGE